MDAWRDVFHRLRDGAGAWISQSLPPLCVCCGSTYTRSSAIDHICPPCLSQLPWRHNEASCLQVLSNRIEREITPSERERARAYRVIVPMYYEAELPRLLRQFKFHGKLELALPLAELMVKGVHLHPLYPYDSLVSVPLHQTRLKERGYNQAYELSSLAAKSLGLSDLSWAMERRVATSRQSELVYAQRTDNLKDAFVADPHVLAKRHVLLVDDILTSGATLWSAMQAVAAAGAASVTGLVVASGRKSEILS